MEWVELVVCCAEYDQLVDVRYRQEACGDWQLLMLPRRGMPRLFSGTRETPVIEVLRAFVQVLTGGANVSSA